MSGFGCPVRARSAASSSRCLLAFMAASSRSRARISAPASLPGSSISRLAICRRIRSASSSTSRRSRSSSSSAAPQPPGRSLRAPRVAAPHAAGQTRGSAGTRGPCRPFIFPEVHSSGVIIEPHVGGSAVLLAHVVGGQAAVTAAHAQRSLRVSRGTGHGVPNRTHLLPGGGPAHPRATGKESLRAPVGVATAVGGCRSPRSSGRRPVDPSTWRAQASLNVGLDDLDPEGMLLEHVLDELDSNLLVKRVVDSKPGWRRQA